MVSTIDIFTDNSPMSPGPPMIVKKCSERKSLCLFAEILDVKSKTAVCRVGAAKSNSKAIIAGSMLCLIIPNRKLHTQKNEQVKKYFYNWILQHPQVVQSPISNYCVKMYIDGNSEPQLVPKTMPQVSVW